MEILTVVTQQVVQSSMNWKEWIEFIMSIVAVVLSAVALIKSNKAERLQNKVNELEIKIKQYELEKIAQEEAAASLACVEARIISLGRGKHRLKVWNSGSVPAYNVVAKFEGDPQIVVMELDKQPFEILDAKKNYEMPVIVHMGSASKFTIITEWTDENGEKHEKRQMGDLQ